MKSSTIALYREDTQDCQGSAVLATYQGRHFVLSASHVLKNCDGFFFATDGKYVSCSDHDVFHAECDEHDFCAFEIDRESAALLTETHRFVSLPEIRTERADDLLMMVGYPESLGQSNTGGDQIIRRLDIKMHREHSSLMHDPRLKSRREEFICGQIRHRFVPDHERHLYSPNLGGFSGGGLYYLTDAMPLAGITLRQDRRRGNNQLVVTALRVEVVEQLLTAQYLLS